jgi:hypothetical protein
MRPCPEAMTPSGVYYRGMQMVVAAVDSMAILLIGRADYSGRTEARRGTSSRLYRPHGAIENPYRLLILAV